MRYIWPAIIGGIAAIAVAMIQYIVAPLVTQGQLSAAIQAAKPTWKIFPELVGDRNQTQPLGRWDICTLTVVGTVHHTQACTCQLSPENGKWALNLLLDESSRGNKCRCQASCVNFERGA